MRVTGDKPAKFDAADGVEFYGVRINSPSTDTHVYWSVSGRVAARTADHERRKQLDLDGAGGISVHGRTPR
jgi:hypothetical protein